MLKQGTNLFVAALAHLFTACLLAGYFPRAWKEAVGVMLLKPEKSAKLPSSYRPISLLCCIGKLFERVVTTRLHAHLTEIKFFNNYQRAYRRGMDAGEHIFRLSDSLALAKLRGFKTAVASLDVEKAFDSIWHDGLRFKLASPAIGLPVKLIRLLSSFLHERQISVRIGSSLSTPTPLRAGTPQGSVLSPVLFNMYVNDIPLRPSCLTDAAQFADDVSMWAMNKNKKRAVNKLQQQLKALEPWLMKWRIKVNCSKTQFITFNTRQANIKHSHF
jgi:hypothetical protein